jgi:hypothetical protein
MTYCLEMRDKKNAVRVRVKVRNHMRNDKWIPVSRNQILGWEPKGLKA